MPLSVMEMQKGAIVCEMFEDEMRDGKPTPNYGKPLSQKRYGRVTKVVYDDGTEIFSSNGVRELWVQFEGNKEPEKTAPARLALHKGFDRAAYEELAQHEQNAVVKGGGKGALDDMGLTLGETSRRQKEAVKRGI